MGQRACVAGQEPWVSSGGAVQVVQPSRGQRQGQPRARHRLPPRWRQCAVLQAGGARARRRDRDAAAEGSAAQGEGPSAAACRSRAALESRRPCYYYCRCLRTPPAAGDPQHAFVQRASIPCLGRAHLHHAVRQQQQHGQYDPPHDGRQVQPRQGGQRPTALPRLRILRAGAPAGEQPAFSRHRRRSCHRPDPPRQRPRGWLVGRLVEWPGNVSCC